MCSSDLAPAVAVVRISIMSMVVEKILYTQTTRFITFRIIDWKKMHPQHNTVYICKDPRLPRPIFSNQMSIVTIFETSAHDHCTLDPDAISVEPISVMGIVRGRHTSRDSSASQTAIKMHNHVKFK